MKKGRVVDMTTGWRRGGKRGDNSEGMMRGPGRDKERWGMWWWVGKGCG